MMDELSISSGERKNYFHREMFVLKLCGISLSRHENVAYTIYSFVVRYFFIISYAFVVFGDLNKHGFDIFAQSFPIFLAALLSSVGSVTLYRNRIKCGQLLNRLQQPPFLANQQRGGDTEKKLINNWVVSSSRQVLPLYVASAASFIFVFLYALIKRLSSSDPQDWIFILGPITLLDVTRSPTYEISWIYQHISTSYIGTLICTIIITLFEILAYICVQFQMLQNNLKTLTDNYPRKSIKNANATESYEIPWKYLQKAVKDVVSYHLNILEVVSEVDTIFSIFMLFMCFIILCILCFVMYAASVISPRDPRIVLFFLEATISFCLTLIVCYWGEQVAYESQQVAKAAYEINFVGSDLRFQKALSLVIMRSQSATRIKAGHLVETSMETFVWIVRSSFSFLMVLRKLNTNE